MSLRQSLLVLVLVGASCRSAREPDVGFVVAPKAPRFVVRPAWEVVPIEGHNIELTGLVNLGDLDADGYDELAVRENSSLQCRAALVHGRDGRSTLEALNVAMSPHHRQDASNSIELAHGVVNVGDTDGDGRPEIAVIECGYAPFARDAPSGVWLLALDPWRIVNVWRCDSASFGAHVVPLGDFDGDGRADILTVNDYNPPAIEVLSTVSDASLWRLELPWTDGQIEQLVAVGDLDGGGCSEVMLTIQQRAVPRWMQCLLRGEDGALLWRRTASTHHDALRLPDLHRAGDVNADGAADLWALGETDFAGNYTVALQSALDGSVIRGTQRFCMSTNAAECPDLDGDGASELIVLEQVNWTTRQYVVEIVSSQTLEPLAEFPCENSEWVTALRTPLGVRIVVTNGSSLNAFDLAPRE